MPHQQTIEIRDLRNGEWYWVHKAVIHEYAQKVGAIGIVVYNLLASLADSHQGCFPSQKYIAKALGYSRSYINEALKLLEKNGLIRIEKQGRYHCIYHLLKVGCQPGRTQVSSIPNSDVAYSDTNDNKRTINIKNIVMENTLNSKINVSKEFQPRTREELLALDLAEALDDKKSLALYRSYARKYPERLLRRTLGVVKEIPDSKIRKNRGALFNYLIKKNAEKNT